MPLFFFFVVVVFLAAAFFAFHLLLAYLCDVVSIRLAFAIRAAAAVFWW